MKFGSKYENIFLSWDSNVLRLFAIYRPPPSSDNKLTTTMFLNDFSTFLEVIPSISQYVVILGDFNIHVDDDEDRVAKLFHDMLDSVGLQQHIEGPTHFRGHTLDLLISRKSDNKVLQTSVVNGLPSDHDAIMGALEFVRPGPSRKTVVFRKLRKIDIEQFKKDITSSLVPDGNKGTSALVDQFNRVLQELLEKHAPLKTKTITLRPQVPWFTDEMREEKRKKRRLERKMKKSGLEVDKQLFKEQCKIYHQALERSKCEYHQNELASCDTKQLFRFVNKLCSSDTSVALPEHSSTKDLANNFAAFFHGKIQMIRDKLDNIRLPKPNVEASETCSSTFSEFSLVTEEAVRKVILESASKSCELDPIPSWLLKASLDALLPFLTDIINSSLSSGIVPTAFKLSHIRPLLKKANLDKNNLHNYRPIANLMFTSKVLERIVATQIKTYFHDNNLFSDAQSAYRCHHSTETALLPSPE